MYRSQLQHVILEIGRRFGLSDFHVVGSAAILAALPNPPEGALTATRDVDVIPPQDDERMADRISFVLGEASKFDLEHGYSAWCMEAHDLVLGKLGAGREKDIDFAKSAAALGLLKHEELLRRLPDVACSDERRRQIEDRFVLGFPRCSCARTGVRSLGRWSGRRHGSSSTRRWWGASTAGSSPPRRRLAASPAQRARPRNASPPSSR